MAQNEYVSTQYCWKKHELRGVSGPNPTVPTVKKAASHLEPDELLNVVREVRGEVGQQFAEPRLLVQDRQETQLRTVRPYIVSWINAVQ